MENYQMNRSGCRPYNRTCGMMNFSPAPLSQMQRNTSCSEMNCESSDCTRPYKTSGDVIPVKPSYNPSISQTPNCPCAKPISSKTDNMYEHLKHLTPAMAYVPYQNFTSAYDLDYADAHVLLPLLQVSGACLVLPVCPSDYTASSLSQTMPDCYRLYSPDIS